MRNIHSASPDSIIKCCRDHFSENDIHEAKNALLDHDNGQLKAINEELATRVNKRRRFSSKRGKDCINLRDIIDILYALDSHERTSI